MSTLRTNAPSGGLEQLTIRARNLSRNSWNLRDLTETPVGMWEPTYDPAVWAAKHELHLVVQNVGQGDAESLEELPPQMISVDHNNSIALL